MEKKQDEIYDYYSYINELPRLTWFDVDRLYESENIREEDIKVLIDDITKKVGGTAETKLLSIMKLNTDSYDELVKEKEKLKKEEIYRFVKGKGMIKRTYPSTSLIKKIVEGHLYLALIYTKIYYKKSDNKYSFDDLFQMASETLTIAAKYYLPSKKVRFSTYASRSIENRLRREIYKEKKKEFRAKNNFFRNEIAKVILLKNILVYFYCKNSNFNNISINRINLMIQRYNSKMYRCFEEVLPLLDKHASKQDFIDYYKKLISTCCINDILDDNDREFIKISTLPKRKRVNDYIEDNLYIRREISALNFYLIKLNCIKQLIGFEKQYKKDNDGSVPSFEEEFEFIKKYLAKNYKESKMLSNRGQTCLANFTKIYDDYYGIFLLGEENENRDFERKELASSFEMVLEDVGTLKDMAEEQDVYFYDYYGHVIPSLEQINDLEDCLYLYKKHLKREDGLKLYRDFTNRYKLKDGDLDSEFININDFNLTVFIEECIKERTRIVSNKVKELNKENVEKNKVAVDYLNSIAMGKVKISSLDFESIYKGRIAFYSLDEAFDQDKEPKNKRLTLEEEVEIREFIREFKNVLKTLPDNEREVIELYYDELGYNLNSISEISSKLNISQSKVKTLKRKAIKKLQESSLKEYLD